MTELQAIGAEIRAAQARKKLSSDKLAQRAKVAPNTISAVRCGESVSTRNLSKILKALGGRMIVEFQ